MTTLGVRVPRQNPAQNLSRTAGFLTISDNLLAGTRDKLRLPKNQGLQNAGYCLAFPT
jgi:hypothetical protein